MERFYFNPAGLQRKKKQKRRALVVSPLIKLHSSQAVLLDGIATSS